MREPGARTKINIDADNHDHYLRFAKGGSREQAFSTMKDMFLAAAFLGWKRQRRRVLGNRRNIFGWEQFSTREDRILLRVLALADTDDPEVLLSRERVLTCVEEYANGGLPELIRLLEQPGGVRQNLVEVALEADLYDDAAEEFEPEQTVADVFGPHFPYYEPLRVIEGGGMAQAFHVADGNGVEYFLKRVPLGGQDEDALQRELQIYSRLQRVDCPHLLQVVDYRKGGPFLALVAEYATGGTLTDHVARASGRRLPPAEVKSVAGQILAGLHQLHEVDVVHRDLKPDNVLRSDDVWKLADFGISKNLRRLGTKRTFQAFGTFGYAAPEQRAGVEANPAADVYSFGKVVTFMLTGQTDIDRIEFPVWSDLVRRCVQPVPDDRATVRELRDLLESLRL